MELKDLASVSGKGGLFKILKPGKSGVVLESLDDARTKVVAGSNDRLSMLSEISIYSRTKEGSTPLADVLQKIKKEFDNDLGIDPNSDPAELKSFMKNILPEYDEDRVYVSDIKKLVRWYGLIHRYAPEILAEESADNKKQQ